jgi:hypothetical protein
MTYFILSLFSSHITYPVARFMPYNYGFELFKMSEFEYDSTVLLSAGFGEFSPPPPTPHPAGNNGYTTALWTFFARLHNLVRINSSSVWNWIQNCFRCNSEARGELSEKEPAVKKTSRGTVPFLNHVRERAINWAKKAWRSAKHGSSWFSFSGQETD